MPCIDSRGEIDENARKILAAVSQPATLDAVAEKSGLPLYRVRSGVRELAASGLAEMQGDACVITEAGRAALAKS